MNAIKLYQIDFTEDSYCPSIPEIRYKKNFFIISGCSGSGKSSLMQEIASRGFKVIHETGRQVVKEQNYIEGDALPWKDWKKFIDLTVSRTMYQYNSMLDEDEIVFFDRAIIDQIGWKNAPVYLTKAALKYRFNETVFVTPPWKEIYRTDNERKHSFDEAVAGYESVIKSYEKFGYKLIYIPKATVAERADFVIDISNKCC